MKSPSGHARAVFGAGQRGAYRRAVPDMQYKFRLIIGPLTLEDYLRFLPGGNNLPVLTELVRTFIGLNIAGKLSCS